MICEKIKQQHHQDGLALVTVLLFLLPITLIAVTSLRMNIADEEMVANSYSVEKARAAAEAALQYAESELALNPALYYTPFSGVENDIVVFDNDLENDNVGDNCWKGLCLPLNVTSWDTSVNVQNRKRGGQWVVTPVNNVWNNAEQYRVVPESIASTLEANASPKYIIEFMGHIPRVKDDGRLHNSMCDSNGDGYAGQGESNWNQFPYCRLDPLLFRITSLGEAGLGGRAKVSLQSTFIVDVNSAQS